MAGEQYRSDEVTGADNALIDKSPKGPRRGKLADLESGQELSRSTAIRKRIGEAAALTIAVENQNAGT
jgi:hypothetical protein